MRLIELAGSRACLSPAFDQLSVFGEFQDLGLALPVSLRHIDLAFTRDEDIVGLEAKLSLAPAAALDHPDALAVLVDFDGARGSPHPAVRQLEGALDAVIGVRQIVGRSRSALRAG